MKTDYDTEIRENWLRCAIENMGYVIHKDFGFYTIHDPDIYGVLFVPLLTLDSAEHWVRERSLPLRPVTVLETVPVQPPPPTREEFELALL
jgi:hypothetical protein